MNNSKFWTSPLFTAAAVLGLALVIATLVGTSMILKIRAMSDTVSVTGSAQRAITSDIVRWRGNLARITGASQSEVAYGSTQLEADRDKVMDFLKKNGVKDTEITLSPVTVNANYNSYSGGSAVSGYTLSLSLQVESSEVTKIEGLSQESSKLISSGVALSSQPLEYYYSKLADLKIDMLAKATENAKERARRIAGSAGSSLGGLRSASMGVLQITPVNSTDVSDYGSYDTSSKEKQITAVVRASFSLDN